MDNIVRGSIGCFLIPAKAVSPRPHGSQQSVLTKRGPCPCNCHRQQRYCRHHQPVGGRISWTPLWSSRPAAWKHASP